jgi:hypothetical protein
MEEIEITQNRARMNAEEDMCKVKVEVGLPYLLGEGDG